MIRYKKRRENDDKKRRIKMTKKRFLSIILTVLMVLSIVPATPAHAMQPGDELCAGVARKATPVYSNITDHITIGTIEAGQGFTILGKEANGVMIYYYINYNNASDPNGYNSYGYIWTNSDIQTQYGSTATVKYNVSVYYGPGSQYQRCGTLYAGETIAVLEKDEEYCYVEYNDNVHGKRKRAYVSNNAITFKNTNMYPCKPKLPIRDEAKHTMCYVGLKYTVYSGPSTQYEPIGSVSDMHLYWVKRYSKYSSDIDAPFYNMLYIRYQVTGTNTWKSGYIVFNYKEAVGCPNPCTLHPGK